MYRKLIAPSVQHLIHNKYILRTFYHFFDKLLYELNLVVYKNRMFSMVFHSDYESMYM